MRQRDIFLFWLPLYASWLLMTGEGPLVSAAVNRLPDEVTMLAALGIVVSLAVLLESPVINLLATATALVCDHASYRLVRRFTVHWMVLVTAASCLLAMTPLFDAVVLRGMGVPPEIGGPVRSGLRILIPWSAAIAWRRFCQGVLIHFRRTRAVAQGTALRLFAVLAVAVPLVVRGGYSGIHVASVALLTGVVAEALYATWAVRPLFRDVLDPARPAVGDPLSYRALFAYHLPLAGTAVLTLLVGPAITISLARLAEPRLTLAAWPLVFQLTLLVRAIGLAWPEVVIALAEERTLGALRRFSWTLAGASLLVMAAVTVTPLAGVYLYTLQNAVPEVAALARQGLLLSLPMPALVVFVSWRRGLLMKWRRTAAVNGGMFVRLAVLLPILVAGVLAERPGIETAVWAINLSIAAELVYLGWKARRRDPGC